MEEQPPTDGAATGLGATIEPWYANWRRSRLVSLFCVLVVLGILFGVCDFLERFKETFKDKRDVSAPERARK